MSWIKVADDLPPYGTRILIVRRDPPSWPVMIGFRKYTDQRGERFARDGGDEIAAAATHWQPLPGDP